MRPSSPAASIAFNILPYKPTLYNSLASLNLVESPILKEPALRASSSSFSGRVIVDPGVAVLVSSAFWEVFNPGAVEIFFLTSPTLAEVTGI